MFCSAKCALPGVRKNVTAVTLSQPVVTYVWYRTSTKIDKRYVTAVTYLCEPHPVGWDVYN